MNKQIEIEHKGHDKTFPVMYPFQLLLNRKFAIHVTEGHEHKQREELILETLKTGIDTVIEVLH